jgi:nucleoside-diphosphate-sugar epimerase
MNLLVTGASGFVGNALCRRLLSVGHRVSGTLLASEDPANLVGGVRPVAVRPLASDTPWRHALDGVETVIHLAARVHIMEDRSADPLSEFRRVNLAGTARLAREAAKAGVRRLVFISTVKVHGEESETPYRPDSPARPGDPYGVSKWEAEQALRAIEQETGLEIVVVRPPLVYGPGVKANFLKMLGVVSSGIPLPLAALRNKRSLIYVENLVDALALCATHPDAAGRSYLVSDGEDVSTPELVRKSARALGVPARLFRFPPRLLLLAGRLTGRNGAVNRLAGSLTVDGSQIRFDLGWVPPFTLEQGLQQTANWFQRQNSKP